MKGDFVKVIKQIEEMGITYICSKLKLGARNPVKILMEWKFMNEFSVVRKSDVCIVNDEVFYLEFCMRR